VTSTHPRAVAAADTFAAGVRPHWDAMTRLARRLAGSEWEDVLQDALALAWRRRDTFDASRGTLRTWLLTLVADQARKSRRRAARPVALLDVTAAPAVPDPAVGDAIARLSPRQRLAVELHYFLDLTVDDAAAVMGCSPGTVKSTLSDARRRLRAALEGDQS
jgi:RNA polymerase sigma-70 factor, ECF subfamily